MSRFFIVFVFDASFVHVVPFFSAVGLASVLCTAFTPVNAEVAALAQHQDPASDGAAASNKALVLELAKQINSVRRISFSSLVISFSSSILHYLICSLRSEEILKMLSRLGLLPLVSFRPAWFEDSQI